MNAPAPTSKRILSVPNAISALRLASVPVFVYLFASGRENAGVALYALGAVTDFLDGYIARRTRSVTEIGKVLDPLADRVFIVALAIALLTRGLLPLWLALAVVGRDLLVLGLWPMLERTRARGIRVSLVGKAATALLLVGLTALACSATTWPLPPGIETLGTTATVAGALAYWAAALLYAREARVRLGAVGGKEPPP